MPQRAPSSCHRPGCPGLVRNGVCSACGPLRTSRDTAFDDRRGSSSERGYDVRWQRLRRMVLSAQPLCVECQRQGSTTLAVDVDHIIPIAQGGAVLDETNLQPLCRSCHNRKTRNEQRHGETTVQVILVCGPPGSGKTTFVASRKRWGDLVVDFDALYAALSGLPWYEKPAALMPFVCAARDIVLARLRTSSDVAQAWVISSEANAQARAQLAQQVGAMETIVLAVGANECLRRIDADPRRSGQLLAWSPIVHKWWREYAGNAGETEVRG